MTIPHYPGEWVVLCKDKVLGHDKDLQKIMPLARKHKDHEIIRVPPDGINIF